jgi:hypothetical protein
MASVTGFVKSLMALITGFEKSPMALVTGLVMKVGTLDVRCSRITWKQLIAPVFVKSPMASIFVKSPMAPVTGFIKSPVAPVTGFVMKVGTLYVTAWKQLMTPITGYVVN